MGGKQRATAGLAHPMAGASDALQSGGDGGRRLDQHHFVEIADVDAHLQRTGGHDGLELAALEPPLDFRADLPRQRAVVGIGQGLGFFRVQLERDLLRHAAAVGEEQRRAVAVDDGAKGIRERFPHLLAAVGGRARRFREAHAKGDPPWPAGIDDADLARLAVHVLAAHVVGNERQGPHRGRQRHALELAGELHQPLKPHHQLRAAPVLHQRVDLVQDHRLHGRERLPPAHRGEQQAQTLRRRDEQFRRLPQHSLPVACLGIAAARLHAQVGKGKPGGIESGANPGDGFHQVGADVVVERLQRRHVEHPRRARLGLAGGEGIDCPQERRQRLAAAGRRRDQQMLASGDARPTAPLHIRRRPERGLKPAAALGMECVESVHRRYYHTTPLIGRRFQRPRSRRRDREGSPRVA